MSSPQLHDFSGNLFQLPRLDKTRFICSYVKEQKAYAKSYASEGRAFVSSWNPASFEVQPSRSHTHATRRLVEYGFDTPVLKPRPTGFRIPRSEKTKQTSNDSIIQNRADGQYINTRRKEKKRKRTSTITTRGVSTSRSRQRMAKAKRCSNVHKDSEQSDRLKERCERRRAKHAIVRPAVTEIESEPESEEVNNRKVKKRNRNKEKLKIPAGFALMHGFSATNVGTGRLTVKHPVGVFNKGKASAKNRVNNKKLYKAKGRHSVNFSETAFLTEACPKRKPRQMEASLSPSASDADCSTLDTTATPPVMINRRTAPACPNTEPLCPGSRRDTSPGASGITPDRTSDVAGPTGLLRNTTVRADSITWDIELDDAPLPSQAPSDSGIKNVILDTRQFSWVVQENGNGAALGRDSRANPELVRATSSPEAPGENEEGNNQRIRSSSSICPSQSASQYAHSRSLLSAQPQLLATSKYFVTNKNQLHRLRPPAKPLEVSSLPEAGRSSSATPFHDTTQMLETVPRPSPPSLLTLSHRTSEEAGMKCNSGISIDKNHRNSYLVRERVRESGSDSLLWERIDDYGWSLPPGSEEATLTKNYTYDDDGDFQTNRETFDFRCLESLSDTRSNLDYLDPGYLVHDVFGPEALGQCPEISDFEHEDFEEVHYNRSLDENPGYSDLNSERGYWDQLHYEPQGMTLDDDPDCFSGAGCGMASGISENGHGLVCATPRFLQGERLLLDYFRNDNFLEKSISLTPSQVKVRTRRPVSLVEADVAKSLRNHWVAQKL